MAEVGVRYLSEIATVPPPPPPGHVAGLHAGDAGSQGDDDPPQNLGSVADHGCDSAAELVTGQSVDGAAPRARDVGAGGFVRPRLLLPGKGGWRRQRAMRERFPPLWKVCDASPTAYATPLRCPAHQLTSPLVRHRGGTMPVRPGRGGGHAENAHDAGGSCQDDRGQRTAQEPAHGCYCQGTMGAGIAKGFQDRYPAMSGSSSSSASAVAISPRLPRRPSPFPATQQASH